MSLDKWETEERNKNMYHNIIDGTKYYIDYISSEEELDITDMKI